MKLKSMAMFAVTGLLAAATLAYVTPAMAALGDGILTDSPNIGQMPTAAGDMADEMSSDGLSATSDTASKTSSEALASDDQQDPTTDLSGTPDTATGDDDY